MHTKFGWINREYPQEHQLDFLLDFDIFKEDEIEFNSLNDLAKKYNDLIKKKFEKCITTKLKTDLLGGTKND